MPGQTEQTPRGDTTGAVELRLGRIFFRFSPLRTLGIVVVLGIIASGPLLNAAATGSPSQPAPWWVPAGNIASTVAGAVLGVLIAPIPRPVDHSRVAVLAVDEVAELLRSSSTLVERLVSVSELPSVESDPDALRKITYVQSELSRYPIVFLREMARWSSVSPGAEDEIVKDRTTANQMLKKLELERENDE